MRAFIDTNIFVYATYSKYPQFPKAREFLKNCIEGSNLWYLSWSVVYEYLRVVTHPQIFPQAPLTLAQAIENVLTFSSSRSVEIIQAGKDHADYLNQLAQEPQLIKGNLVHDAHTAVLMREHDLQKIYTADTDFHRFKGLEVVNPVI